MTTHDTTNTDLADLATPEPVDQPRCSVCGAPDTTRRTPGDCARHDRLHQPS